MSIEANEATAGTAGLNGRGGSRALAAAAIAAFALIAFLLAFNATGAEAAPPTAPEMLAVSDVSYTTAQGEANLKTDVNSYYFEVSTDGVNWAQHGPMYGPVGGQTVYKNEIPNLTPGTHYFVRAVSYFFAETTPSANSVEMTTQTVQPPEVVSIDNASSVAYTTAHTSAKFKMTPGTDPAFDTYCYFEYVTDDQFKNSGFEGAGATDCEGGNPFTTGTEHTVAANIANLAAGTKYHLRLRVENKGGVDTQEAVSTFTTLAVAPPKAVEITAPTEVAYSSALFHGKAERPANPDPAFEITGCVYEVVSDEQFQLTGFENIQFGYGCSGPFTPGVPQDVSAKGGTYVGYDVMPYGTTFHVRLSVQNLGGTDRVALTGTFTTLPQPPPPALTISAPTGVVARSANVTGTVDPGGNDPLLAAFWRFECVPACEAVGGSSLTGAFDPPSSGAKPVAADLKLKSNTEYEIRLVANNYGGPGNVGPNGTTAPVIFKTPVTVNAKTGSATVTPSSAGVSGQVDPGGDVTSYHFDYGFDDAYGQSSPVKSLVASDNLASVSANLTGLQANTIYHYRLVASNSAGEVKGDDRTFTTGEAPTAEESCPNKAERVQQKSTFLGECRAYEIVNSPSGEVGDTNRVPGIATDGNAAGWITTTPGQEVNGNVLVSTGVGRRTSTGWVQEDANVLAVSPTNGLNAAIPYAFSPNMSHVLLSTPAKGDPLDTVDSTDLYRVPVGSNTGGTWLTQPQHISFNNYVGASADLSKVVYGYPSYGFGPSPIWMTSNGVDRELISLYEGQDVMAYGTGVSSDASRVFFGSYETQYLYMRDTVADTTDIISVSQRAGDIGTPHTARYLSSSPDGEIVYFISSDQLTDAATVNGGIYRVNTVTDELALVTPNLKAGDIGIGEWLIPNKDKNRFYFTSPHFLAPGSEEGANNVYVVDGNSPKLVVSLPSTGPGIQLSRVNNDGRFAVLMSTASINGATNNKRQAIYLYDDDSGRISCASCRPNGAKSQGSANLAIFPLSYPNCCLNPRAITDHGGVFFATADQLLPADETAAQDVYYYNRGSLSLMSNGKGDKDNYLGSNTDDGKNVFIMTRSALVPKDRDAEEMDIYDVRVDGGFFEQPVQPPLCQGEACRTNPSQAPPATAPSTPSFIGADNSQSGRNQGRKKKNKNKGKKNKNKGGKKKGKNKHKRHSNGRSGR